MAATSEIKKKKSAEFLDYMQFPQLDFIFSRYLNLVFYSSLFLLFLFGILLFDGRISTGGDDSDYLLEAMKYSRGESFPSFHGVFYTLFIGWLIKLTGFHLILFKAISMLFLLAHHCIFFISFRKRVSPFLLGAILLIMSVSSSIIYYGSQTYTEAFYMFLQAGLIYLIITGSGSDGNGFLLKKFWKFYLATGAALFMMTTTRNIGFAALGAVLVYFLLERKYLQGFGVFLVYLVLNFPYTLFKKAVWGLQGSDLSAQMRILLQKDSYNPSFGYENFAGLLVRFFKNAGYYLSTVFLQETGLQKLANPKSFYLVSFIIICLLIAGAIFVYRQKRTVFKLPFLYIGLALSLTFISLSPMWQQNRLLVIFIPLLLLLIFYTLAEMANQINLAFVRILVVGLLGIMFLSNFSRTVGKASEMSVIRKSVRKGDKFSGYTPDYRNFLAMSEWAAVNIPKDVNIGSRKASMSFIYGDGRIFHPMYKLKFENTDSLLSRINPETPVFFIDDLVLEKINPGMVSKLKVYMEGIISFDDAVYSMFLPGADSLRTDSLLHEMKIKPLRSVDQFKSEIVSRYKRTTTLIPDELLDNLYRNDVHYLINASLRVNPEEKSDRMINTIERYMIAIHSKYPGAFTLVKQMGDNNDEPARLYRIDYGYCEKRGWEPGSK